MRSLGLSNWYMRVALLLVLLILGYSAAAHAQAPSRFLELESPGRFSLRLFSAGYGSEKYGTTHAGFEIDQTITRAISIIGRVSIKGLVSTVRLRRRTAAVRATSACSREVQVFRPFRARHSH